MATTIIKIEKEDVTTNKIGENFMITCKNDLRLMFTEEAIKELIQDYSTLTARADTYSDVKPNISSSNIEYGSSVNPDKPLLPPAPESRILREGEIPKPPTTNT